MITRVILACMLTQRSFSPGVAGRFQRSAFTLIELLVVVAIVAVLAGMLMPALNQVRQAMKTIQCASNQRQTGLFLFQYCSDNDGRFPGSGQSTGSVSWHDLLNLELLADQGTRVYRLDQWDISPLRCPSLDRTIPYKRCWVLNFSATGGTYDAATNTSQYGVVFDPPASRGAQYASWTRYVLGAFSGRFSATARTALIGDVFSSGDVLYDVSGFIGGARHGSGRSSVNVLFMDGHVETMEKSRLATDIKYVP
jgi:prepilin-type N-terminal cleavage/methylation domain-containing protein/prepilin-type processing-associated H-X9-DG protein